MQYMGSKNRFAKELVPIIQSYIDNNNIKTYIEPFVGGANVIDKIECEKRIGYDNNEYLIALLNHTKETTEDFPKTILQSEYNEIRESLRIEKIYEDWYYGLVGFCGSFGQKFFRGYAKNSKDDLNGERVSKAIINLKNQSSKLKNIEFDCIDFIELKNVNNCVIYCDPPYNTNTKYSEWKYPSEIRNFENFPYEKYYNWCREMSVNNIVLCSEYWMPDDFKCIWEKKTSTQISSNKKEDDSNSERIEKLYILSNK